jgi:hypothetical protein
MRSGCGRSAFLHVQAVCVAAVVPQHNLPSRRGKPSAGRDVIDVSKYLNNSSCLMPSPRQRNCNNNSRRIPGLGVFLRVSKFEPTFSSFLTAAVLVGAFGAGLRIHHEAEVRGRGRGRGRGRAAYIEVVRTYIRT